MLWACGAVGFLSPCPPDKLTLNVLAWRMLLMVISVSFFNRKRGNREKCGVR